VVALIATAVLLVRERLSLRLAVAALAFVAVVWLGLLISFSQSSFASLLVAVLALAAVVWRWKSLFALAAVVVVAAGIAVTQPRIMHALRRHTTSGLNHATSGRATLIAVGIKIAKAHPSHGVGLGGFERAYSKRTGKKPKKSASHNTPVTVAAEEGGPGLLVFFWLVGALLLAAYRRIRHGTYGLLALAAGLSLLAIFVHSLAYNDFFEDPTTWGLIGLVALVSPVRVRARELPPVETPEPVPEMIAR
jgi:O-antigen ligase